MSAGADLYAAARTGVVAFARARDVVDVHGPDAESYLQGQLSQDVAAMEVGDSARSLVLQPQGKLEAFVRVTRTAGDRFVIDVDGGFGPALAERLRRFMLRVDVELGALDWSCVALRGPDAEAAAGAAGATGADGGLVVAAGWAGLPGVDVLGGSPGAPPGVALGPPELLEVLRIEAGEPAMGHEIDERVIPQELGVADVAVSFTKGCYTGQELVARIDSRGHVNRHLRGLLLDAAARPAIGGEVRDGDRSVGTLTSVAPRPDGSAVVGLAFVRREVEPPADVVVDAPGGPVAARVEALPLVS